MDNTVLGINEPGIELLIKELQEKSTLISDKLTRLQAVYEKLSDYCVGAQLVNDDFINNIDKTREAIEFNINSYTQDLNTLQQRLKENDKYMATLFDQATIDETAKNTKYDHSDLIRKNREDEE